MSARALLAAADDHPVAREGSTYRDLTADPSRTTRDHDRARGHRSASETDRGGRDRNGLEPTITVTTEGRRRPGDDEPRHSESFQSVVERRRDRWVRPAVEQIRAHLFRRAQHRSRDVGDEGHERVGEDDAGVRFAFDALANGRHPRAVLRPVDRVEDHSASRADSVFDASNGVPRSRHGVDPSVGAHRDLGPAVRLGGRPYDLPDIVIGDTSEEDAREFGVERGEGGSLRPRTPRQQRDHLRERQATGRNRTHEASETLPADHLAAKTHLLAGPVDEGEIDSEEGGLIGLPVVDVGGGVGLLEVVSQGIAALVEEAPRAP